MFEPFWMVRVLIIPLLSFVNVPIFLLIVKVVIFPSFKRLFAILPAVKTPTLAPFALIKLPSILLTLFQVLILPAFLRLPWKVEFANKLSLEPVLLSNVIVPAPPAIERVAPPATLISSVTIPLPI